MIRVALTPHYIHNHRLTGKGKSKKSERLIAPLAVSSLVPVDQDQSLHCRSISGKT
jgi:hypothetical protein